MTVKSVAYNSVSLAWTDNASNETGFKLERSPNGVDFVGDRHARCRHQVVYGRVGSGEDHLLLPRSRVQQRRRIRLLGSRQRHHAGRAAAAAFSPDQRGCGR